MYVTGDTVRLFTFSRNVIERIHITNGKVMIMALKKKETQED